MFLLSKSIYPRPIIHLCKQGVAALFSFFRNHSFQNAARWARGPVLKGPARRILEKMISKVATEGRTRPILYLCKQGVAALFSFFRNEHFQNAARWARGPTYLRGPRDAF